jgi:hypothetical protein
MSDLFKFLKEHNVDLTLDRTNSTELELLAYDRIQSLEAENKELRDKVGRLTRRGIRDMQHEIAELRSKLAVAVEALEKIANARE